MNQGRSPARGKELNTGRRRARWPRVGRWGAVPLALALLAAGGCERGAPGAGSRHATIEAGLRAEAEHRKELASGLSGRLGEALQQLKVGDPVAVADAEAALGLVEGRLAKELEPLSQAVEQAEAQLGAAQRALGEMASRLTLRPARRARRALRCGSDGCGGDCGTCPTDAVCGEPWCWCVPDCEGKACGPDGCGGVCGETGSCGGGSTFCSAGGLCLTRSSEEVCTPQCRRAPTGPETVYGRERDHSASPSNRAARQVGSEQEATTHRERMEAKIAALKAELTGLDQLASEIRRLEEQTETSKAAATAAAAEIKRLTAEVQAAKRALAAAKDAPEAERAGLQTALEGKQAALVAQNEAKTEARAVAATASKEAGAKRGQAKRSAARRAELQQALGRLGAESARLLALIEQWKEARQSVGAREKELSAARAALTQRRAALTTQSAAELGPLKRRLEGLQRQAIERAEWPDVAQDPALVSPWMPSKRRSRVPRLAELVCDLRDDRVSSWERLDRELRREPPEEETEQQRQTRHRHAAAAGPAQAELVDLETLCAQLEALAGANRRLAGLRAALLDERERLSQ